MQNYYKGVGVGLRKEHFNEILNSNNEQVDWFEILSENFMTFGGKPKKILDHLKDTHPLICHGVGLSLGSADEVGTLYISKLKDLVQYVDSPWFSDHLCFAAIERVHYHDLIPALMTKESLQIMVDKINLIQDIVQKPFVVENVSYYVTSSFSDLSEESFINKLIEKTGAYLLLDVNNVYVNHKNHKIDPLEYIKNMPLDKVIQIHLAGHWDRGDIIIDTHGDYVCDEVWTLYEKTLKLIGKPVSTLIEWDHEIPEYKILCEEADKAKQVINKIFSEST